MTYEEILLKTVTSGDTSTAKALEAVVLLHKPYFNEGLKVGHCKGCQTTLADVTRHVAYPCKTIWAIENILG